MRPAKILAYAIFTPIFILLFSAYLCIEFVALMAIVIEWAYAEIRRPS